MRLMNITSDTPILVNRAKQKHKVRYLKESLVFGTIIFCSTARRTEMGRSGMLLLGAVLLGVVSSQNLRSLCNSELSCRECILVDPDCVWCATANYTKARCYVDGDTEASCLDDAQNPMGSVLSTTNVNFGGVDLNQISPVRANVQVRPLKATTFDLSVQPANNFPIDLYLLMDLSFSMQDDLANLKLLGSSLANRIESLSTNYKIGFGSFVEKRLGPFTSLDPDLQNNPCPGQPIPCQPTYSYRHVVSLTDDNERFNDLVQAQQISGNQDTPEGGFDGFLQSIVCTELIGWRPVSRKLLLFITDAGFHFAGDGKLGGVVLPHRSVCSLPSSIPTDESNVQYTGAETFDYPSIGQIARALRDEQIIPIFAATSSVRAIYESLAAEIGEGAFVGTLERDSSNVVSLVENLYNTISQRVIFEQVEMPGITVTVVAKDCPDPGFIEDGVCNGLQIEETATFTVSVSVNECTPELLEGGQIVTVRAIGFGSFDILVNATCQCACEAVKEPNSVQFCSGNGTFSCGQCTCNPGNFGKICQCSATNQGTQLDCPVGSNNLQCSGRGTCACGVCSCQSGFFGPMCECDERDCINQELGLVCSGRGTCGCNGQCMCNTEPVTGLPYQGDMQLCECTPNFQNCRDPSNKTSICNGRGICGCDGTCMCQNPYFGDYCEICSGSEVCFDTNCESNHDCANCVLDIIVPATNMITVEDYFMPESLSMLPPGSNLTTDVVNNAYQIKLPNSACTICGSGAVIINGTESTDYQIGGQSAVRCEVIRDTCTYRYFVAIDDLSNNFTAVHVEYTRSCPEPQLGTAPWIIAIGIIIPLLVLGILALILFKVLLLVIDYVEVKIFERELANIKFSKNENPIFQSAAKEYKNPIYGQ